MLWARDYLVMLRVAAAFLAAVIALALLVTPWLLALLPGLLLIAMLPDRLRTRRRRRLDATPLAPAAREILANRVSWYRRLSPGRKAVFERDVRRALHEYEFEAAPGAQVTDELKVLASASIVLLTFGQGDDSPLLFWKVLFHPGPVPPREAAGQYRHLHSVALSIPAFLRGWTWDDGDHVGLHECAHALDYGDFKSDGVPWGMAPRRMTEWRSLVVGETDRARAGRSFLAAEAGSSESELFAYLVEAFFERPERVRAGHPRLYELLDECLGGPAAH